MSSYSDIIFLTGAMIVFSSLTINTARSFHATSQKMYQADLEYRAISLAQDEIDKVQWVPNESLLNSASGNYMYNDFPKTVNIEYGQNDEYSDSFRIDASSTLIENSWSQKRYLIEVSVENTSVSPEVSVSLNYIKTYAK